MRFHEGQKEYFGKKGMSLQVDVFFIKRNRISHKQVHFTALYRCDQGTVDTLSIAYIILTKIFLSDEPCVKIVYGKSDNASSYHANFSVEALYFLCKSKGIKLVRYDFHEPCRGKDQYNRETAGAKSLIRSYVDGDHHALCTEDIYAALHYGNGMKNSAIAVAQAEEKTLIRIKNSKSYTISFF